MCVNEQINLDYIILLCVCQYFVMNGLGAVMEILMGILLPKVRILAPLGWDVNHCINLMFDNNFAQYIRVLNKVQLLAFDLR